MELTFTQAALEPVLADAVECWKRGTNPLYGQEENPPPGFWLVGDEGVYIMHNGKNEDKPKHLAYALECDPNALDFDTWWDNKRATWGGDDGADYIEPEAIIHVATTPGALLRLSFTPEAVTFVIDEPRKAG